MCAARDESLPPSVIAARRAGQARAQVSARSRAYPVNVGYDDHEAVQAQLGATRALLSAASPEQVAAIVATLVRDLGGGLVSARLGERTALPMDVSFGVGEPVLPWAEPVSVAEMRLSAVLPHFIEDARGVVQRLQGERQTAHEAEFDQLTGLLTRRAWMRRLGQVQQGDSVARLHLDHFKQVNDTLGHAAGDLVLRSFGACLRQHFRDDDACGRYGGDELACLTPGMPAQGLAARLDAVRLAWRSTRPPEGHGVGLSVGVVTVGPAGARAALEAADRALYRAKTAGRDRTNLDADPTTDDDTEAAST